MESHLPDCCIFNECQAVWTLLAHLKWSIRLILCRKNTCISCCSLLTGYISTTENIVLEQGQEKLKNPAFGVGISFTFNLCHAKNCMDESLKRNSTPFT